MELQQRSKKVFLRSWCRKELDTDLLKHFRKQSDDPAVCVSEVLAGSTVALSEQNKTTVVSGNASLPMNIEPFQQSHFTGCTFNITPH